MTCQGTSNTEMPFRVRVTVNVQICSGHCPSSDLVHALLFLPGKPPRQLRVRPLRADTDALRRNV